MLRDWSSSGWTTLDEIRADVMAGNRPLPTLPELLVERRSRRPDVESASTFHDLRHEATTRLRKLDVLDLSCMTGHAT